MTAAGRRRIPAGLALPAILALAAVTRLHHLDAPMADNLQAKQVYVANKARSIAGPPFDPLRNHLDFLDPRGDRIVLVEEVPLYTGLLAAGYRTFGERDAVGHLLSLLGSLAAIAAFFDLARREHGERSAIVATLIFASAPLFIFYGRAVLADPWMLAGMLGCAAAYRRYLDGDGRRWLVAAGMAGILAAMFKYFGLMVMLPLAAMTWRARGWRGLFGPEFVGLGLAMVAPIAAWMGLVFLQGPNPVDSGWTGGDVVRPYLIVQDPGVLLSRAFYAGLLSRFTLRDCGPVAALLMILGVVAVARGRAEAGPVGAWTAMGLLFYALLGPKLIDHDYYELMMLPAASLWAAAGWAALSRRFEGRLPLLAPAALAVLVVVQSPWVLGAFFTLEGEKLAAAEALRESCPPGGRAVVMGPGIALVTVVHYAGLEGWAFRAPTLPDDWPDRLAEFREQGAEEVVVYFDPRADDDARASFAPLIDALPVLRRGAGGPIRDGRRAEFVVLRLG